MLQHLSTLFKKFLKRLQSPLFFLIRDRMLNISIPKKESEAIASGLSKYQKVLAIAKARDLNESDTVTIISDILADVFGYDKYLDITSEYAIRGTFCDLVIKINDHIEYLIECKSVGTDLKDNHLKQAVDYGANQGVNWVILTNGLVWQLHKIHFEQPISHKLVMEFDISTINPRSDDTKELLYILHKSALSKNLREEHYTKTRLINPYTITQVLFSPAVISSIRKEIRRLSDIKLDDEEISTFLSQTIVKRDLIENESAKLAEKTIKKLQKAAEKKSEKKQSEKSKNATLPESSNSCNCECNTEQTPPANTDA